MNYIKFDDYVKMKTEERERVKDKLFHGSEELNGPTQEDAISIIAKILSQFISNPIFLEIAKIALNFIVEMIKKLFNKEKANLAGYISPNFA